MKKQNVVFLKGKTTTLRPLHTDDLPLLVRWINDPEIRDFIHNSLPMTEMEEKAWLESKGKKDTENILLMIEVKGVPIGTMGIHRIDWKDRVGTTGALIGEKEFWNKGFGTDAKMVLLNYAFNTLNLRKIMSTVKEFNKRSLAYSLHCGYKIEGRLKKHFFVNGKYYDQIILGLFRSDWLPYWQKYVGK